MPDHTTTPRAVFLSYAREDAEAVRRIADALRAFGVEVWFDQNELRGGDAWDQKIRTQIRTCALCVPVISAATQARGEGYFRREWKIAVERTHDMAAGMPFLLPVVIDDTAESAALVPEEFMRVQWTRLAHGVPTPQFVEQVRKLLENPGKPLFPAAHSRPSVQAEVSRPPKPVTPRWSWGVIVAIVVGITTAVLVSRKPAVPPVAPVPATKEAAEAKPVILAPVAPKISDKSIAVLPFENMSEEKDASAFFADGVQEDVLTNLSFIRELRVVSRTSVMQYRATKKPIGQVAAELGVAYVLEGSVRRVGNKVRVTGQLIRAATDEHVWAKAYDRDITDVFAIQAELAQEIAASLQAAISPTEKSLVERRPTTNPEAYALYVKARSAYQTGNIQNMDATVGWLVDAVQLDPGFAQAWAQIAALHASEFFSENDASAGRLQKAKAAIETAVRLAPDDPVVIEMQGDYYYYGYRDFARAVIQYERLLALRPNSAEAYGSLGLIYRRLGRWAEASASLRRAVELDPHSGRYAGALANHLFSGRRFGDAIVALRYADAAETIQPGFFRAAIPYLANGSVREVNEWFAHLQPRAEDERLVTAFRRNWARVRGDFAEAIQIDAQQPYDEGDGTPRWQQDFNVAMDFVGVGDTPAARTRFEKLLPVLKTALEKQPTSYGLWNCLGLAAAMLGDREQALLVASKLAGELALPGDAVEAPNRRLARAQILAWVGRKDEALLDLAVLLRTPYGAMVEIIRHDPNLQPLHGDPRFDALLADPKNNAPLF